MEPITIIKPSDMHTHIRQGEQVPYLASITAKNFAYIEVMPNTNPAILTGPEAISYKKEAEKHTNGTVVIPSIKITPETTEEMIREAKELGILAGKLYFGITTNEKEGARGIEPYLAAITAMEKYSMILLIHGEMAYKSDGTKIINLRREEAFVPIAKSIVKDFPMLKVVFEHITTAVMAIFVECCHKKNPGQVAATITAHHLMGDIDSILGHVNEDGGEGINPHAYNKPVNKMPEDRDVLRQMAIRGLPCFFFGSDSAPHPREAKESCCGKPGVFSAKTRIESIFQVFEEEKSLHTIEKFLSINGPTFYGLPVSTEKITVVKEPWVLEEIEYHDVRHARAKETIQWKVLEN